MSEIESYQIKVSSDKLVSMAENMEKDITELRKNFLVFQNRVEGSSSYWEGEAHDKFVLYYNKNKEFIERFLERLKKIPGSLLSIAGEYVEAEQDNVEMTSELVNEIIE